MQQLQENLFDYQLVTVNRTKQPCLRDLIFQYYIEKTHSIVLARELTNSYIAEMMKD